ncbi:porin family protein [Zhouia sp. PK063]|uniref:porin family protein n=1 Tax=Zhouia sp. PK063 TaxID=3373602 RepID=UPI003788976D
MKKILFVFALICTTLTYAQSGSGWGLKAGFNYNSSGKLSEVGNEINSDGKVGYHLGLFAKADLGTIYLRPELMYTKISSEYDGSNFDMQKIDLPVLVGVKVIGPLNIFAGPAFQYILDTNLDDASIENDPNDITVGFNFGAGVSIGNLGVDLRYERGFSDNEAKFIRTNLGDAGTEATLDTRPSQLILSLSLKL